MNDDKQGTRDGAADEPSVELVPVEGEILPSTAITLQSDAAGAFLDGLGELGRIGVGAGREASAGLYRIVPSAELQQGLGRTLQMATPQSGDASVLVKHKKTGRIAGHADLKSAKPSALKILGPAAWQAMALATQQHYLVEINTKLERLETGVAEILALLTEEKVGELIELRDDAERFRSRLQAQQPVNLATLEDRLHDAGVLRRQLVTTARRVAREYHHGKKSESEADDAFQVALYATKRVAELSAIRMTLPTFGEDELRHVFSEERERLEQSLADLREIAQVLNLSHHQWEMHHRIYSGRRPESGLLKVLNRAPLPWKVGGHPPLAAGLSTDAIERVGTVLRARPPMVSSMLLEVGDDGTVRLAVDGVKEESLPALLSGDPDEETIAHAITQYTDGSWWVYGHYGPYKTKAAAITRLKFLGPEDIVSGTGGRGARTVSNAATPISSPRT